MKKLLLSLITIGMFINVQAASTLENKVFVGELTIKNNSRAILESKTTDELKKEVPEFNIKKIPNYSSTDLSINLHNISTQDKKKLFDKCNDGQICKLSVSVKKEKISANESESYWLIKLQKVEVLKSE